MNSPKHLLKKDKRDRTFCCVPQCNSQASRDPHLSFHKFPFRGDREKLRCKQWVLACRIGKKISSRMTVCSKHFKDSDYFHKAYNVPVSRHHLKKTAIPSLNLPNMKKEKHQSPVRRYNRRNDLSKYFKKEENSSDKSDTESPLCHVKTEEAETLTCVICNGSHSPDKCSHVKTQKTEAPTSVTENSRTTIRISNLPEETYHSDLHKLFGSFGKVDKIYVVKTSLSGKCSGLAFIHYLDHEQASRAFLLDGHTFGTKVLKVEWAKGGSNG